MHLYQRSDRRPQMGHASEFLEAACRQAKTLHARGGVTARKKCDISTGSDNQRIVCPGVCSHTSKIGTDAWGTGSIGFKQREQLGILINGHGGSLGNLGT